MALLRNKKTKVVKEITKEFEASMYLGTGEWEVVSEKEDKREEKPAKAPIINTKPIEE
jgi:hypothetical protein